jgi:hypothetical protein
VNETQRIASTRAQAAAKHVTLLVLEHMTNPVRVCAFQLVCLLVRVVSDDGDVGGRLVVEPDRLRSREKLKVVSVAVVLLVAAVLLLEPIQKLLRLLLFRYHAQLVDQLLLAFLLKLGPPICQVILVVQVFLSQFEEPVKVVLPDTGGNVDLACIVEVGPQSFLEDSGDPLTQVVGLLAIKPLGSLNDRLTAATVPRHV